MDRRLDAGRRTAAALLAGAAAAGVVALAAAPVAAAPDAGRDKVAVRAPSSFEAGGSPGAVNVGAAKRSKGCAIVRSQLAIRLSGLAASQVRAEVARDGQWRPLAVSGGGGTVATAAVAPTDPVLCNKKSVTVRYRLTFLADAPAGTAVLAGQVITAAGEVLGQAEHASRVVGTARATASPTPRPSRASATPSPEPTVAASDQQAVAAAPAGPSTAPAAAAPGGGLGLGGLVMVLGIGMVGVGVALLVVLLRRNRAGADEPAPVTAAGGGYPSGTYGGAPAWAGPDRPGSPPPAAPAWPAPPPRPGWSAPADSAPTGVLPRQHGPVPPGRPGPVPPGRPGPVPPGRPGPVPPEPGGPVPPGSGEATMIMPRLPEQD
ncbi:hypothetical protein ACFFWC_30160 [Plantactinospora siamensis]|uniref:Uncharacterized protein n=1 Tax=Plantactinospora siamensis TaxID=555372 RepID=A0ABV6NU25_9ACTN